MKKRVKLVISQNLSGLVYVPVVSFKLKGVGTHPDQVSVIRGWDTS
jgi:hypothetical protein